MSYARLGDATTRSEAIAAISATHPSATQKPDAFAIGVQTGVLNAGDRALYDQWNGTYGATSFLNNFAASIVARPALTALLVSRMAVAMNDNTGGLPWETIWQNISNPAGATILSSGLEIPTGLTAAQLAPYLTALDELFPIMLEAFAASDAEGPARDADTARMSAQAAAMAQGTTSTPYGPVATSLIAEGPVTLPDGMVFLVMNDISRDPSASYVLWWQTAGFVPPFGVTHYGNECGWAAGTGAWYMLGALGASCPPPPVGWVSDGFRLMSPRAKASVTLDSTNTLPVNDPTEGGSVIVTPGTTPVATTTSPIADEGPRYTVTPGASSPPIVGTHMTPGMASSGISPLVLLLGVAAGAYLLTERR